MANLIEIQTGQAGLDYLAEKINTGAALAEFLKDSLNEKTCAVTALLAKNVSEEEALDFNAEGSVEFDDSKKDLLQKTAAHLSSSARAAVIFENRESFKTDKGLKLFQSAIFFIGSRVYHILRSTNDLMMVEAALLESMSAKGHLFFFVNNLIENDNCIEGRFESVYCDAYCMDGFLKGQLIAGELDFKLSSVEYFKA